MRTNPKIIEIRPQKGPQEQFLASPADIVFYGGAAGGGKSFGLLLDPIRDIRNTEFRGAFFRREGTQLTNPGGLWDESQNLYSHLGGKAIQSPKLKWFFRQGRKASQLQFSHLQHEKDIFGWQGAQVAFIGFDEVNHFTKKQFFYMQSRVRSMSGVRGRIRATCNPDPDSWVKEFILWWLDEDGEYARRDRAGVLRWFIVIDDKFIWADTKAELVANYPTMGEFAKSATFIPASIHDNQKLLKADPGYLANLNALSFVDRMRLANGNWKIRPSAGNVFRREWFEVVKAAPADAVRIRYWDRAGTEAKKGTEKKKKGPDATAGLRMSKDRNGVFYIEHVSTFRETAGKVEENIKNTATQDGIQTFIGIEQDPGQAGKAEASYHVKKLAGFNVRVYPARENKIVRAKPLSAQAEAGNVKLVEGPWNEDFLSEVENFPDGDHDDQVDAASGAFNALIDDKELKPKPVPWIAIV